MGQAFSDGSLSIKGQELKKLRCQIFQNLIIQGKEEYWCEII
jgi:hypothetical protein